MEITVQIVIIMINKICFLEEEYYKILTEKTRLAREQAEWGAEAERERLEKLRLEEAERQKTRD